MTSVEWLILEMNKTGFIFDKIDLSIFEQAKKMENEQKGYSEEDMKLIFEMGYRSNNFIESTVDECINYIKNRMEIEVIEPEIIQNDEAKFRDWFFKMGGFMNFTELEIATGWQNHLKKL